MIDASGTPQPDEFDPSFDRSMLTAILSAIRADLQAGLSGGQLPIRGLEWFEIGR
jgi:hypothetical protein